MTLVSNDGLEQSEGALFKPAWDQALKALRAASADGDFPLAMQALQALQQQIAPFKDPEALRHLKAEIDALTAVLQQEQRQRRAQLVASKQQRGAVASYRRCETLRR